MKKIAIAKTEEQFDALAASRVIGQIMRRPSSVIGLSTGRTTHNMHRVIARFFSQFDFNLHDVTFFGVDEVMNVPREYAGACYTMLRNELIDDLRIDDSHFLMLPTHSDDYPRTCHAFEQTLESRGGIDLLILGLGENGHLGFNQPGTPFESVTRATRMDEQLEKRIRRETNTPSDVFLGGISLGLKTIMHSRKIVLVAKGAHKADMVRQMLEGPITPDVPASVLQLHPDCEFLLDTQAAKYLQHEYQ